MEEFVIYVISHCLLDYLNYRIIQPTQLHFREKIMPFFIVANYSLSWKYNLKKHFLNELSLQNIKYLITNKAELT